MFWSKIVMLQALVQAWHPLAAETTVGFTFRHSVLQAATAERAAKALLILSAEK